MRESIGGTLLFWIALSLLMFFIIFMTFIVKYARVYKIKNSMISYIEKNEGVVSQSEFDAYLLNYGYPKDGTYKICRYLQDKGGFFTLELYSVTEFPVFKNLTSINIAIRGETRTIVTGTKIRNVEAGGSGENNWFYSPNNECKICSIKEEKCNTIEAPDI